jgi:hypothetical protein
MRFCKITTTNIQDEIDEIIMSMNPSETEDVIKIYGQISLVEYTDENDYECMFAILDSFLITKLNSLYKKYGIKFIVTDLTQDVINDSPINTKYKNYKGKSCHREIQNLIKEFKMNWVSKDDILDKILEKGIDSLSKIDLKILKS